METIISACISAGVALAVCLITQHAQNAKDGTLLEYRLDELSDKVSAHNNLIDHTYRLEEENRVQKEKISIVNHRIDDLEKKWRSIFNMKKDEYPEKLTEGYYHVRKSWGDEVGQYKLLKSAVGKCDAPPVRMFSWRMVRQFIQRK